MKKLPMLTVPLKGTEAIDWSTPLRQYIASHYGNWNDFTEETAEFNKLRTEVVGCNHDNVGLSFYFKYYSQLELLDMRIPSKEAGGVNVLFTWYDSFNKSTKISQHSIAFEKASILFNLGALLTVVANSQYNNHNNDDVEDDIQSFKNALANYQNAAGVYQFVSENFLHAPSNDLNQTTVKFLGKLALAQAQEVFTLNLIINKPDNENYSLLAKLLQSTSNFYGSAYELISSLVKDEIWYSSYSNWLNIVNAKKHYFQALASYFQSLLSLKNSKFGDAIAYIKSALDSLNDCKSTPLGAFSSDNDLKQNFVELIKQDNVKEWIDKLKKELSSLERDNDYIYHDSVPQKFNLPTIKAMDAVKPNKLEAQLHDPKFKLTKDLFKNIVPLKVHEYSSVYSEEKAKRLRAVEESIDVSNESLASFYDYLGLPKTVQELKALLSDPNSSHSDIEMDYKEFYKHKLKPLMKHISEQPELTFVTLFDARTSVLDDIGRCEALLKSDEDRYNERKLRYGASWTQQDPSLASMEFKNALIKVKKNLVDTEASDRQMADNFAKIQQLYKQLRNGSASKKELKDYFLNSINNQQLSDFSTQSSLLDLDDSSAEDAKKLVLDLDANLNSLNHLKKEIALIFNDYKDQIHNDDISDILVMNKALPEDKIKSVVFPKELEKFEPYESRISKIVQKQQALMNAIKANLDIINKTPTVKEKRRQFAKKQKSVMKFYETVNRFEKDYNVISVGVSNGKRFYEELTNFLNRLELHIKTFVAARNDETDKLATSLDFGNKPQATGNYDNINERLANLNLSSSSIPTTTTTNNNIYSSDIANQNRYSSISTTTWNQAPLIPKKSSISSPMSTLESSYYQQPPPPSLPQFPTSSPTVPSSNIQNLSNLYGSTTGNSFGSSSGAPPALPPKQAPAPSYGSPQQQSYGYQPHQQQPAQYPQAQPQQPQQTGIPFYNTPSNYSANMYSMFSDENK